MEAYIEKIENRLKIAQAHRQAYEAALHETNLEYYERTAFEEALHRWEVEIDVLIWVLKTIKHE